mgnify:CR=1 FL=1
MVIRYVDSLDSLKIQGREKVQVSVDPLEVLRFFSGGLDR